MVLVLLNGIATCLWSISIPILSCKNHTKRTGIKLISDQFPNDCRTGNVVPPSPSYFSLNYYICRAWMCMNEYNVEWLLNGSRQPMVETHGTHNVTKNDSNNTDRTNVSTFLALVDLILLYVIFHVFSPSHLTKCTISPFSYRNFSGSSIAQCCGCNCSQGGLQH